MLEVSTVGDGVSLHIPLGVVNVVGQFVTCRGVALVYVFLGLCRSFYVESLTERAISGGLAYKQDDLIKQKAHDVRPLLTRLNTGLGYYIVMTVCAELGISIHNDNPSNRTHHLNRALNVVGALFTCPRLWRPC